MSTTIILTIIIVVSLIIIIYRAIGKEPKFPTDLKD